MIDNIITALAKALPEVGAAIKDRNNPAFKSAYADLSSVIEAIRPVAMHGLWFRQSTVPMDGQRAAVETFYIHSSGQELSAGITDAPVSKNDAQGYGSALTYCRRYGLMAAFGIAPEDDDGNAASKAAPIRQAAASAEPPPRIQPAAFLDCWQRMLAQADTREALAKLWTETKQDRASVKAQDAAANDEVLAKFKARDAVVQAEPAANTNTPANHQTPISAG